MEKKETRELKSCPNCGTDAPAEGCIVCGGFGQIIYEYEPAEDAEEWVNKIYDFLLNDEDN